MRACGYVAALLVIAFEAAAGQTARPQRARSFEVASVKTSAGAPCVGAVAPDRFLRCNITLSLLLAYAFDVPEFQIVDGPAWTRAARFDVDARALERPTRDEMRAMARDLLAERFKLRTHAEQREMERFALTVRSGQGGLGPKLKRSKVDCAAIVAAPDYRPPTGLPGPGEPFCGGVRFRNTPESMTMQLDGVTVAQLASRLQAFAGRAVVDKTGLEGTFDVELEFEPPANLRRAAPSNQPRRPELSLPAAVRDQLGLDLRSERGPVSFIVVDDARRPGAD
jgi:uncharacterized protein (TIGR03435 family)